MQEPSTKNEQKLREEALSGAAWSQAPAGGAQPVQFSRTSEGAAPASGLHPSSHDAAPVVGHWADAPVQRSGGADAERAGPVQSLAGQGFQTGGHALPHGEQIQRSFGRYDIGGLTAHTDANAAAASQAMGAKAYASSSHVAFADGTPSLHTAAHEAAHAFQQQRGVQLQSGIGRAGDAYEQHADAVADRVVRGESAEALLGAMAGPAGGRGRAEQASAPAVQMKEKEEPESVVYLGINDASRQTEKAAFAGQKNATLLMGSDDYRKAGKLKYTDRPVDESGNPKLDESGNPIAVEKEVDVSKMKKDDYLRFMQGKTLAADGKSLLDLNNDEDVEKFLEESGIGGQLKGEADDTAGKARLEAVRKMFQKGGFQPGVRDEMAQFVQVLKKVQNGEMKMDRLVMSGHSTGGWVYSEAEDNPGVTFEEMAQLMQAFPAAQSGVQDLMLSACHTLENYDDQTGYGGTEKGEQYKKMLPNLQTVWGYNKQSPSYQTGSVGEIQTWLKASQGNEKGAVTKAAYKRRNNNATALEGDDIGNKAARQRGEKAEQL